MKKYKFNISPNQDDINEIMNWLKCERDRLDEGFYCNRNIINKSFEENEIITFQISGKNIGFIVWTISGKNGNIDIFEISPDYRKKGLGKEFGKKCLHFFKENDYEKNFEKNVYIFSKKKVVIILI